MKSLDRDDSDARSPNLPRQDPCGGAMAVKGGQREKLLPTARWTLERAEDRRRQAAGAQVSS